MTDRATLKKLIADLEAAERPSRELDARIVTTLCSGATVGDYIDYDEIVFHAQALGIPDKHECPAYTASLDAALTLMPAGYGILELQINERGRTYIPDGWRLPEVVIYNTDGATPSLAVCHYALRAALAETEERSP